MKKNCFLTVFSVCIATLLVANACQRGTPEICNGPESGEPPLEHGMIVLGEKLDNPYTVDNFTKALTSLYPGFNARKIVSSTHRYARFLPRDSDEYALLEKIGLELSDHPVDYRIVREGDYYHDPEIPQGEFTWQYAVVPCGTILPPKIRCEILDDCFIPDEEELSKAAPGIDWRAVEEEAFRITGNENFLPDTKGGTKASFCPEGRIFIHDDRAGEDVGVAGVKVSCNIFVKFASAYTDKDGYYKMNVAFSGNPHYRLVFKNEKGFAIGFNLIIIPASISTLGRGAPTGLDCFITKDSDRLLFCRCAVNNAVNDYFELCRNSVGTISQPPVNLRLWLFSGMGVSSSLMLQQGALIDGSFIEKFLGTYLWILKIFLPDITIGLVNRNSYADVYSNAIHQCAHASHYARVGNVYWNKYMKYIARSFLTTGTTYGTGNGDGGGNCEITEDWAYYLESKLWNEKYQGEKRYFGEGLWFHPRMFMELDELGLDKYKIFSLLSPDIENLDILESKILCIYPEMKKDINAIFQKYY